MLPLISVYFVFAMFNIISDLREIGCPRIYDQQHNKHVTQLQFSSMVDAIIRNGDYGNWANFLARAGPSVIPANATLFITAGETFLPGKPNLPRNIIKYHIVLQRLSFSDLLLLPSGETLLTAYREKTLVIGNNSAGNITINGVAVTHAELLACDIVCAHGLTPEAKIKSKSNIVPHWLDKVIIMGLLASMLVAGHFEMKALVERGGPMLPEDLIRIKGDILAVWLITVLFAFIIVYGFLYTSVFQCA